MNNTEANTTLFHFKIENTCYCVTRDVAKLSTFFKTLIDNQPDDYDTETKALVLQIHQSSRIIDIIYKYFKIWESNPTKSKYITDELKQAENPLQVFDEPQDLALISSIVEHKDLTKYQKIKIFAPLLKVIDGFLNIECFANKIYAYIAMLLRNSSLEDMNNVLLDDEYAKMQKTAGTVLQSNTTGNGL